MGRKPKAMSELYSRMDEEWSSVYSKLRQSVSDSRSRL